MKKHSTTDGPEAATDIEGMCNDLAAAMSKRTAVLVDRSLEFLKPQLDELAAQLENHERKSRFSNAHSLLLVIEDLCKRYDKPPIVRLHRVTWVDDDPEFLPHWSEYLPGTISVQAQQAGWKWVDVATMLHPRFGAISHVLLYCPDHTAIDKDHAVDVLRDWCASWLRALEVVKDGESTKLTITLDGGYVSLPQLARDCKAQLHEVTSKGLTKRLRASGTKPILKGDALSATPGDIIAACRSKGASAKMRWVADLIETWLEDFKGK